MAGMTPEMMKTEQLLEQREIYNNLITKYGLDNAEILDWLWQVDGALETRGIK